MDWSSSLGSSSRALATEHKTCANCGSSNLEEDTIHMLVVSKRRCSGETRKYAIYGRPLSQHSIGMR